MTKLNLTKILGGIVVHAHYHMILHLASQTCYINKLLHKKLSFFFQFMIYNEKTINYIS